MRSIAVLNQKGGVGKTTTAVNLSAALATAGQRVCLVDFDPQAHATLHLGLMPGQQGPSIYDVLVRECPLWTVCRQAAENLWVVGSHIDLAAAEVEFVGVPGRELVLRNKLAELNEPRGGDAAGGCGSFDFLIVDCPPSLGILTLNALAVVDDVILPLQPHFLALHGLSKLLETIELVSRRLNPGLKLNGVVLCLYESATRLAAEVAENVAAFFAGERGKCNPWSEACIFETRIRRNIRLAEAPSFGQSIFEYAPDSHGAVDYRRLADEVLHQHAQQFLMKSA